MVLSMESTSNRMSRLGKSVITDTELLTLDRIIAEIDAVDAVELAELAAVLLAPQTLSASGIGPNEDRFLAAVERVHPGLPGAGRGVKVAVFGSRGKVGAVVVSALAEAGHEVVEIDLGDPVALEGCEAAVDFTQPDAVVGDVAACAQAGVPCVVGTTGFDRDAVERLAQEHSVPVFHAPNFAIGAVLMMRFAADAAQHLPKAEIIELHQDTKVDAPSGTAKATAEVMEGTSRFTRCACPGSSRTRR